MGVLKGSMTYLRFIVDGTAPLTTTMEKAIEARRFVPLRPTSDTMESAGWVPLEAPFDDERPIGREAFLYGDLVALAYREDRYAIPKALLQRETKKAVDEIVAKEGRAPESITRAFVKAVEQRVLVELKGRSLPRSKVVDLLWTGAELRVYARGAIATERIAALFERTFGVRIELASAPARAFALEWLSPRSTAVLERLSPTWFFPDAIARGGDEEVADAT